MNRKIVVLLLTVIGVGWYHQYHQNAPKPHVKAPTTRYHGYKLNRSAIAKAKGFTVLLSNEGFAGTGRGTGVLIDSKHVLTCAHMLMGPKDDMWIFPYPAGIVVKGKPVAVDTGDDLAVLELSTPVVVAHYAKFRESHYDGQPITIIGNTKGAMRWFVTFGIISGEWEGFILTDGVLYGGNSGGPWINEWGEVVALTDWTLLNRDGVESSIHGGVSAMTINKFLKSWKSPSILQILMGSIQ